MHDANTASVGKQKASADQRGRKNLEKYKIIDRVLLSTTNIPDSAVTNLGKPKLTQSYIGPFKVIKVNRDAYQLDIPSIKCLHPTFYVGRLNRYWSAVHPSTTDQEQAHNAVPGNAEFLANRAGASWATPHCPVEGQNLIVPNARGAA